jgi:hypothetical protein
MLRSLLMLCILSGCATPYGPETPWRGGYSDIRLNDTVYEVAFQGNGHSSEQHVRAGWLVRSSDIARTNGFRYFRVLDADSATETFETNKRTDCDVQRVNGTTYKGLCNERGGMKFHKRRVTGRIKLLKEKPADDDNVYDSKIILNAFADRD